MKKPVTAVINLLLTVALFCIGSTTSMAKEQTISEKMTHSRLFFDLKG